MFLILVHYLIDVIQQLFIRYLRHAKPDVMYQVTLYPDVPALIQPFIYTNIAQFLN